MGSYLTAVDTSLEHDLSPLDHTNNLVAVSNDEVERVIREKTALIAQPIRIGRQVILMWDGEAILLRNLAGAIRHIQPEKLRNV